MIDPELLKILCCPETHQGLVLADVTLVQDLNRKIAAGQLRHRSGQPVQQAIDAGLVRSDGRFLYPVRHDIPVMLIDEAIPLSGGPQTK
jgi:uncharacterized protein